MRAIVLLLLVALPATADELPPQMACGGGEGSPAPGGGTGKVSEFPVTSEGADGMTAYLYLPDNPPRDRRVPLLFVLHGNGDSGKGRHANLTAVSSKDDPIIVVGIQYQKEATFNAALWDGAVTLRAFDWLLEKTLKEQPVDPDHVYLQGFSMGCGYAGSWAYKRWKDDPKTFPFRALFFNGSPAGARSKDDYPPVPFIAMVGEKETAVLGTINVVKSVKTWANQLARAPRQVEYHEIPGMEHAVNGQCHQIIRDTILRLRGPRDLPAWFDGEAARTLRLGRLAEGFQGLVEAAKSKELDSKARKAASDARKRLEEWSATEMKRLESLVAEALVKRKSFEVEEFLRLRELATAFPDAGRKFSSGIASTEKKQAEELKRRDAYLAARAKEAEDVDVAKTALEALAAVKGSRTAQAAAYRLSWWMAP
jgi:acetyl esterase/lipase